MYFRQALELQAFLDMAKDEGTWRKIHLRKVKGVPYLIKQLNLMLSFHFINRVNERL